MRFDILTLFPEIFDGFLSEGLLNKAIQNGLLEVKRWNFRDWASDRHRTVDDRPYGGGPGMLIGCEAVFRCVEQVQLEAERPGQLVMMTPYGRKLDQNLVTDLARFDRLLILCGRYEGFDERISTGLKPMEISVGDFICNGGEVPAMIVIETVMRLIPGVLGDQQSAQEDSFSKEGLLEYPQYTRPRDFRGMSVPEVLVSGDHQKIAQWRKEMSLQRTRERRDDLLDK